RPAARERVGLGLRGPVPDRRDLRQLPAPQARPAGAAADPHAARGGLHAAGDRRERARRMTGSGQLSLRARLLVLLIAVTAASLVIRGGLSTFVLTKRLNAQFNTDLLAAIAAPGALPGNAQGDLAAAVVPRIGQVVLLTPTKPGQQLQRVLSGMSKAQF